MTHLSFAQLVCLLSVGIVLLHSIAAIGRMTFSTDHLVRTAYILVSTGSFGEIAAIVAGHEPALAETIFLIGIGAMCAADRRCSALKGRRTQECHKGTVHHV